MSNNHFFLLKLTLLNLFISVLPAFAQDTHYGPVNQQIPPPSCLVIRGAWEGGENKPCTPESYDTWLRDVRHWRAERRIRVGLSSRLNEGIPDLYEMPSLKWTHSAFIQPLMMVHDRYFYDPVSGKYTVDRYLDDLNKRYGGIDAVLI